MSTDREYPPPDECPMHYPNSLADTRPAVLTGTLPGHEIRTHTLRGTQVWQQYGWLGHSGYLYALGEDPSGNEPGGFSPLYVMIENEDPPEPPDEH